MYFGRGEALTSLSGGSPFFEGIEVGVYEEGWAHELGLVIGVDDGRPVLNKLTIERRRDTAKELRLEADSSVIGGQRPILNPNFGAYTGRGPGPSDLRKIPLDRIFTAACERVGAVAASRSGSADLSSAAKAAVQRRRHVLASDFLKRVAVVVKENPDAPTRAVAERLFTSHRTASRWIAAARSKGFLEEDKS